MKDNARLAIFTILVFALFIVDYFIIVQNKYATPDSQHYIIYDKSFMCLCLFNSIYVFYEMIIRLIKSDHDIVKYDAIFNNKKILLY